MSAALEAWYEVLHATVLEEVAGAVELRRRLHADPRLSGQEKDTADAVVAALGGGPGTRRRSPAGWSARGAARSGCWS